jgi:hypothetical protein
MAKYLCPFCCYEYDKSAVPYFCSVCEEEASPGLFESEPIKCRKCGGIASVRKCPGCLEEIPKTALETPNLLFGIMGADMSGMSTYITVMLDELKKASALRLRLAPQNEETREQQDGKYRRLYEQHFFLESTTPCSDRPQIWSISNLQRQPTGGTSTYTLVIFDGAGEDYQRNFGHIPNMSRFFNVMKAIILTVDPLVLPNIKNGGAVDPVVMKNSLMGAERSIRDTEEVINNLVTHITTTKGMRSAQRLNIPVAVVFTKFDTLFNQKAFGPLAIRDGKVDAAEFKRVDEEIRNWLHAINEVSFINMLESHFMEVNFFGVSSFGAPPKGIYLEGEPQPHRVLDPMLWLFKKAGVID